MVTVPDWHIFRGNNQPRKENEPLTLPPSPPWRQFQAPDEDAPYRQAAEAYWSDLQGQAPKRFRDRHRGSTFQVRSDQAKVVDAVNAALYLRRPLLITGRPGSGKTSLAYAIAYELQLGPTLMWPITARSTLSEGLYRYDAIARLQDAQLTKPPESQLDAENLDPYRNIGDYIQLGPLGTAFLPLPLPRVLLIDEIDKSDINLPNDLLNLLEEGEFEIPELVRLAKRKRKQGQAPDPIQVRTADDLEFPLQGGKVSCQSFPLIVMTSNGERDFPPAFLRRCLQIEMPKPTGDDLQKIVAAHLGSDVASEMTELIQDFATKTNTEAALYATDQLLNAVYMRTHQADVEGLKELLFRALTSSDRSP
jgi:MoxR-like ATPase